MNCKKRNMTKDIRLIVLDPLERNVVLSEYAIEEYLKGVIDEFRDEL